MEMVLDFIQLSENQNLLSVCGGKGRNLFLLKQKGFNVPEFIILPYGNIEEIVELKTSSISQYYNSFDTLSQDEIIVAWENLNIEIDNSYIDNLHEQLEGYFGSNYLIAIRSSVTSEDGNKTSFAGLFHSSLNVKPQKLKKNLIDCYSSLYHPNVYHYSKLHKLNVKENRISLVIQTMIDAGISGVVFTMNPNGNYDDLYISAASGSGEGVVNNTADVSNYTYNRQSLQWQELDKRSDLLSGNQIQELYETSMLIEREMGNPQDIEFSYDKNGKLWILQARPITTIDITKLKILDNSNIVESYPGITLPLSYSYARIAYQEVFTSGAYLFRIPKRKVESISEELSHMIEHVNGRVYYNLHYWYKLMQMIISSQNSLHAWENLIGVKSKQGEVNIVGFIKKIRASFVSISLFIRYPFIVRKFYKQFEIDYGKLRNYADKLQLSKPTAKEVFQFYDDISKQFFKKWSATLLNDFFTFKFYDLLSSYCRKYSSDNTLANDLLCGLPDVESEILIKELLNLKKSILENEELVKLFNLSEREIINNLPAGLKQKMDDFINRFGDRTHEELKLESPNYRMNPEGFIKLIKSQLQNGTTVDSLSLKQKKIADSAEELISKKQNRLSLNTWIFKYILRVARITIRNRENMRIRRARTYGAVKELFAYVSVQMKKDGVLENEFDVHYLKIEELKEYCLSDDIKNYKELVIERKNIFSEYRTTELPDRLVFNGEIPTIQYTSGVQNDSSSEWIGTSISKGIVEAECLVLTEPDFSADVENKILITQMTDPAWVFLMTRAAGLVSEKGSPLSHTAIVGREMGIPVLIGVKNATKLISSGSKLQLNCDKGFVKKVT